jgi:hypothetical protein
VTNFDPDKLNEIGYLSYCSILDSIEEFEITKIFFFDSRDESFNNDLLTACISL